MFGGTLGRLTNNCWYGNLEHHPTPTETFQDLAHGMTGLLTGETPPSSKVCGALLPTSETPRSRLLKFAPPV